nr:uncharacterized PE-PGRS family protein PE_PGRS54-like [Aegilops tauschii subsp. strangulata]
MSSAHLARAGALVVSDPGWGGGCGRPATVVPRARGHWAKPGHGEAGTGPERARGRRRPTRPAGEGEEGVGAWPVAGAGVAAWWGEQGKRGPRSAANAGDVGEARGKARRRANRGMPDGAWYTARRRQEREEAGGGASPAMEGRGGDVARYSRSGRRTGTRASMESRRRSSGWQREATAGSSSGAGGRRQATVPRARSRGRGGAPARQGIGHGVLGDDGEREGVGGSWRRSSGEAPPVNGDGDGGAASRRDGTGRRGGERFPLDPDPIGGEGGYFGGGGVWVSVGEWEERGQVMAAGWAGLGGGLLVIMKHLYPISAISGGTV